MNTRFASLLLLVTALAASAVKAAPPQNLQAQAHPVKFVERFNRTLVARGFSMADVQQALGKPSHKLNDDVWAYYNFNAGREQDPADDCRTLLITFSHGQVTDLKLINDLAQIVYAAQLRLKAANQVQVAAK